MWITGVQAEPTQPDDGQIELVAVELLKPRPDNPRTHSKRQIALIPKTHQITRYPPADSWPLRPIGGGKQNGSFQALVRESGRRG